jgi:hypothetical protein
MAYEQPGVEDRVCPVGDSENENNQQGQAAWPGQVYIEAVDGEKKEDGKIEPEQAAGRQGAECTPGIGAAAIPRNSSGKGSGTHAPPK